MKPVMGLVLAALALAFCSPAKAWDCPSGQIRQQAPAGTPTSTPYYDVVEGIAFICVPTLLRPHPARARTAARAIQARMQTRILSRIRIALPVQPQRRGPLVATLQQQAETPRPQAVRVVRVVRSRIPATAATRIRTRILLRVAREAVPTKSRVRVKVSRKEFRTAVTLQRLQTGTARTVGTIRTTTSLTFRVRLPRL